MNTALRSLLAILVLAISIWLIGNISQPIRAQAAAHPFQVGDKVEFSYVDPAGPSPLNHACNVRAIRGSFVSCDGSPELWWNFTLVTTVRKVQ